MISTPIVRPRIGMTVTFREPRRIEPKKRKQLVFLRKSYGLGGLRINGCKHLHDCTLISLTKWGHVLLNEWDESSDFGPEEFDKRILWLNWNFLQPT